MQVRILGQIEVTAEDTGPEPVALGGPTQRRLLAALALHRNEVVSVSRLVEVTWPEGDPPARAERNVRTYVHRLRSSLHDHADRVETVGAGYRLRLDADELDAARFEQLAGTAIRLAETGDTVAALDAIAAAERLWGGHPLEEFEHEDWAVPAVVGLREMHSELRATQAEALLEAGKARDAVAVLEGLVRDEPLRERPRGLLIRALYESGRHPEALRAFQDFRRELIEEIGVEPSAELVELDRAIARGELPIAGARSRWVGSYELHERLGEGAFAVVHRATQASLGREVAVKVIRAELANRPEFIRRFEAEARAVAAVEHPNVVPLYDYWREPDRAFLVMRWMSGGSLQDRLDAGPFDVAEALGVVDQVAAALDAAHKVGVVHRDVKPANILFDEADRAYLSDFGIAVAAGDRSEPETMLSTDSPAFASPEHLRREPVGPEADVYSLAVVAYIMLAGRTPFAGVEDDGSRRPTQPGDTIPSVHQVRPEIPADVDGVLATATAANPTDRYPTAPALALALRAAASLVGDVAPLTPRPRQNPYKGLRAFDETDSADFYGRNRLVDELVDHLGQNDTRLLAVVGPSGSGKSSIVRAGLIPALRNNRILGSSRWFITAMSPGARPYEALETGMLRIAVNPPAALLDQLRDGDRGIVRAARRIMPDDDDVVAIVIDQFEEIFTGGLPSGERDRFLRAITVAATEPSSPVRFVLTLRADFYDRPLLHPDFAGLLKQNTVVVPPLAPDELERAIVRPAAAVGVGLEPGLIAELVADVNHEPGALPLLQYVLTRAFDATDGDTMNIDTYHSLGGLKGALGHRAEELWRAAGTDEQLASRSVFGRLVALGEGTEDTRRRVPVTELGEESATRAAIEMFGGARLLTFDRDPTTREPTVEIAHEALIREWPRLGRWLDEDRDLLRTHRHLTATAAAWAARNRDPNELYRGARLDAAEPLLSGRPVALNDTETEFLRASARQRDELRAMEARRLRRLRGLVAALAVVAAVAVIAGGIALVQRAQVESASYDSETARLVATAQSLASTRPRPAMLVAAAAYRREQSPRTLGALHAALAQAGPVVQYLGWGSDYIDVEWLPNGRIVGVRADGLDLFDPASGTIIDHLELDIGTGPEPPGSEIFQLAQTPFRAASGGQGEAEESVLAVALATGEVAVFTILDRLNERFRRTLSGATDSVDVAPDGRSIVASSSDGTLVAWSLDGDELFEPITFDLPPNLTEQLRTRTSVAFFPELLEGQRAWIRAIAHEDHIHISVGAELLAITYDGSALNSPRMTFTNLAAAVPQIVLHVLDTPLVGHVVVGASSIGIDDGLEGDLELTYAEDTAAAGTTIVAAFPSPTGPPTTVSVDGTFAQFDVATGERHVILDPQVGPVRSAAQSPGRHRVALSTAEGIVIVSTDGAGPLTDALPRREFQRRFALTENGRYVVIGPNVFGEMTEVYERVDGNRKLVAGYGGTDFELRPGPGNVLWVWGLDGLELSDYNLRLVGLDGATPEFLASGRRALALVVDDDPTGNHLAAGAGFHDHVVILDPTTLEEEKRLPLPPGIDAAINLGGLRFDPSGSRLLVSSNLGRSQLWDIATWQLVDDELLADHDIAKGYWSDDGSLLATASAGGLVTIRHGDTLEPIRDMIGATQSSSSYLTGPMVFSDDNSLLLTNHDNVARLWDVATGRQIGVDMTTVEGTVGGIAGGDSLHLVTGSDQSALVWNLNANSWPDIACTAAGSNLTRAEWAQWGPRREPYRPVCEQFAIDR